MTRMSFINFWIAEDSFDVRLAKLEKSILPLYTATQILNRRRSSK